MAQVDQIGNIALLQRVTDLEQIISDLQLSLVVKTLWMSSNSMDGFFDNLAETCSVDNSVLQLCFFLWRRVSPLGDGGVENGFGKIGGVVQLESCHHSLRFNPVWEAAQIFR